ncbi:hypothetical protein PHLGIDRAFT_362312 [Phlebiopsis gigantea 11061_1 CR5-6]|uniref:Uncharacterized protein n=1 Tax=Phlebiopsis gigantea (strain 11061_1 CR5-6) TaxID=745531 RepID=A0A0C3RPF7_PHLG1|nr:hypothetical protein PHLGIDRAFT_362312 [Phlebiopsis gigantea 11061_1 CR5-6]
MSNSRPSNRRYFPPYRRRASRRVASIGVARVRHLVAYFWERSWRITARSLLGSLHWEMLAGPLYVHTQCGVASASRLVDSRQHELRCSVQRSISKSRSITPSTLYANASSLLCVSNIRLGTSWGNCRARRAAHCYRMALRRDQWSGSTWRTRLDASSDLVPIGCTSDERKHSLSMYASPGVVSVRRRCHVEGTPKSRLDHGFQKLSNPPFGFTSVCYLSPPVSVFGISPLLHRSLSTTVRSATAIDSPLDSYNVVFHQRAPLSKPSVSSL